MNTEDIIARLEKAIERWQALYKMFEEVGECEDVPLMRDAIAEIKRLRGALDSAIHPESLARDGGGVDPPDPVPKPKPDETEEEA